MTCIIPLARLILEDWLNTYDVRTARRIRNRLIFGAGLASGAALTLAILVLAALAGRAL